MPDPDRLEERFCDDARITEALFQAFRDALRRHRLGGVPVVVYDDGRIQYVPAEQIEQELAADPGGRSD